MSIATLKEELLRELVVSALDDGPFVPVGAGTDLLDWVGGPPNVFHRAWVFTDKGPGLIRAHVKEGERFWFAPGASPIAAPTQRGWVVTAEVLDAVERDIASFLENVLAGHVWDAP